MLEKEIALYQANLAKWLIDHPNQYVAIKEEQLIGFFNSRDEALTEAVRQFGNGPYLIRKLGDETITYNNIAFNMGILHAGLPLSNHS